MLFRLVLAGFMLLSPGVIAAQEISECGANKYCVEDQFLRIEMDTMTVRDSIVNLGLTYTNPLDESVELAKYSIYLIATSANGERLDLSTVREHLWVDAGGRRSDAYSLKFNELIGDEIDLIFIFENPDARYAILGARAEDFADPAAGF